jgi:lysophospholipid acyltransferase (LPLAT)-like uncharacterized protein
MTLSHNILGLQCTQQAIAFAAANYLQFVRRTCSFSICPSDIYERVDAPCIIAMWHGQHFMMPFLRRDPFRAKVLISRHRDGEINALVAERLGVGTIRGSGTFGRDVVRKGGVTAFRKMLTALGEGYNVALTADVPKLSRVVGRGIVQLAYTSQRPIYPVAPATTRRVVLNNWDRTTINLPFGRFALAVGQPIRVEQSTDEEGLERARLAVEAGLNAATDQAYAIVDK